MRPKVAASPSSGAATPADSCSVYSHANSADAIASVYAASVVAPLPWMAHGGFMTGFSINSSKAAATPTDTSMAAEVCSAPGEATGAVMAVKPWVIMVGRPAASDPGGAVKLTAA